MSTQLLAKKPLIIHLENSVGMKKVDCGYTEHNLYNSLVQSSPLIFFYLEHNEKLVKILEQ